MIKYRKEIDGLRALAVLPIILFHAGFSIFKGGFVGVDIFLVISGYLITSIILAEQESGTFSLINFYARRVRRILPVLFLVIACSIPFAWWLLIPSDMKDFSKSLIAVSLFSSNILFCLQTGYFDRAAELKPLLHTWSLSLEEQFYVLFPLCLLFLSRFAKKWTSGFIVFITVVSLVITPWIAYHRPNVAFFLLPTRVWELSLGALIACYHHKYIGINFVIKQFLSIVGLTLICYAVFFFSDKIPFPSSYTLVPTIGTALIICFATSETLVGKLLSIKPLVGIGLISYSAYLWHQPLLVFAKHEKLIKDSYLFFIVLIVFLLAYINWKFIEFPIRQKKFLKTNNQVFLSAALVSLVYIVIGVIGYVTNGFVYRYPEQDRSLIGLDYHEAGGYVNKRFNMLAKNSFDLDSSQIKILIIGDSFAKDLVNVLYESNIVEQFKLQIVTKHISNQCGNLFISRNFFYDEIVEHAAVSCQQPGLFEDQGLKKLMLVADEVWFASAWTLWQAKLIAESINNVKLVTKKPVRVFGTKGFGKVDLKSLITYSYEDRIKNKVIIDQQLMIINETIKNQLESGGFIDIQSVLCGSDGSSCHQFLDNGTLISYDGFHLTKHGAKFCGIKLLESKLLHDLNKYH